MVRSAKMRALLLLAAADVSSGFLSPGVGCVRGVVPTPTRCAAATDANDASNEDAKEDGPGFSALPPIGASSFWDNNSGDNDYESSDLARPADGTKQSGNGIIVSEHTSLVSPKFQLQYTCKVCDTRNSHSVTRMAYRKGVVIAMCKGCHSKHLIADNLGWSNYIGGFDFDNGERNIETYMENRDLEARENGATDGEKENDLVMRVSQDVFDLESVLYKGGEESPLTANGAGDDDQVEGGSSWN